MFKETNEAMINKVKDLYFELLNNWNNQNGFGMSELFSDQGIIIGFDGSTITGKDEINSHLTKIFAHHKTGTYISKIKTVRSITPEVVILQAMAGMISNGKKQLNPDLTSAQTLVSSQKNNIIKIELFQNTPLTLHTQQQLK